MFEIKANKSYLPGHKRIISDIFFCSALVIIMGIYNGSFRNALLSESIGYFVGSFLACFFLFFFWSWKKEQVTQPSVRRIIHIFFCLYSSLLMGILGLILYLLPLSLSNYVGWFWFCYSLVLAILASTKYSNLMCPENPKFYILNNIKSTFCSVTRLINSLMIEISKRYKSKPIMHYSIIGFIAYVIMYPLLLAPILGLPREITTIPFLIILSLCKKTVWLYLFLFWFSWNLFSILKNLNATWEKSIKNNK